MRTGAAARRGETQRPLIAFGTPPEAARWKRWLLYSPLARIAIFALVAACLAFLAQLAFAALGWNTRAAPLYQRATGFSLTLVAPTLAAYLFLVLRIERRRPGELAWHKLLPHGALGIAMGVLLISAVVGVLWLAGSYEVAGTNPDAPWALALLVGGLSSAIAEELVFRGILFRVTEEGLGTWPALAVSAGVFGLLHIANRGATAGSSVAIAIEAGLFSGVASQGWLVSSRTGPDWLTGGSFGAEASVVTVGISLLCSLALLAVSRRRQTLVAPGFVTSHPSTAGVSAG